MNRSKGIFGNFSSNNSAAASEKGREQEISVQSVQIIQLPPKKDGNKKASQKGREQEVKMTEDRSPIFASSRK
jgi:hypothetical protein